MFSYRDERLERWLTRQVVGVVAADVDVARSHYRLIWDEFHKFSGVGAFRHVWHPEDLNGHYAERGCLVTVRDGPPPVRPPRSRELYEKAAALRWPSFELWKHDFGYDTVGFYTDD